MRLPVLLSTSFAFIALSSYSFTHAQITFYGAQSVFIEGKGLYIHGGRTSDPSENQKSSDSGQNFILDLSTTWSTEVPRTRLLPDNYPSGGTASTLYNNKKSWFLKDSNAVHIFDIESETWTLEKIDNNINQHGALGAIADPNANDYVYVINGYKDALVPNSTAVMMKYDVQAQQVIAMGREMPVPTDHAIVWSSMKGSAFIYGGDVHVDQSLVEFFIADPKNVTSVVRRIIGDVPAGRSGHCMVEAYNGTQIHVFGGNTGQGTTADMYMIDVNSMRWTRLKTGPLAAARSFAACAVTNDMFVAWGGATWDETNKRHQVVTTPVVVYNMKTGEWSDTFDPSLGTSTRNTISIAAIAGGTAGALLLIGALVAFVLYRRKKTRRGLPFMKVEDDGDDENDKLRSHSATKSSYQMDHRHNNVGNYDQQQQQQYHQQHPYQEQQHYYQQEPLLDPFADNHTTSLSAEHSTLYPHGSQSSPVNDSIKVEARDYSKTSFGGATHSLQR
ncbi:hypothetical protein FBU30_002689 [Linnemannia zychae]|nr:hypothetical protein FBU30_002689 [Linnemannia zychae]